MHKKRKSLFCRNGQFVCHPDGLSPFQNIVGMWPNQKLMDKQQKDEL